MISIHAPRTGSDYAACVIRLVCADFNPRSPHGERHNPPDDDLLAEVISIHAPRTGSDPPVRFSRRFPRDFNPRSPHGERPFCGHCGAPMVGISIHAPRTGSDHTPGSALLSETNFNPRSPHGERQNRLRRGDATHAFQSTLPARGATIAGVRKKSAKNISIHAPRTGSDSTAKRRQTEQSNFNPRSPHGARPSRTRLQALV